MAKDFSSSIFLLRSNGGEFRVMTGNDVTIDEEFGVVARVLRDLCRGEGLRVLSRENLSLRSIHLALLDKLSI